MLSRPHHNPRWIAFGLLLATISACSFIEFERGPYAVRGLDVVYSEQEDLTFLVWRLRNDALLDQVGFELYEGGEYIPLDLSAAPYPGDGYGCDRTYVCFQYQLPGRYEFPDGVRPVRSLHARHGLFEGSPARRHD
ncbi:MAG: hypothetical protein ACNA8W_18665, partial [Bradymonadaceae bacterium]